MSDLLAVFVGLVLSLMAVGLGFLAFELVVAVRRLAHRLLVEWRDFRRLRGCHSLRWRLGRAWLMLRISVRPREARELCPSHWRGFLFLCRKRPLLAARWVVNCYVCRPVSRGVRVLARAVSRGLNWLSECVSPALRAARAQRAWGRVELAQQFNRKGGSL